MAIYFGSNKVNIKGGSVPTGIIPSGTMDISANGVYDITSYASASVNLEYYGIYKNLMTYGYVSASGSPRYTAEEVSNWCNSYSDIKSLQFAGHGFYGDFTFTNVSYIGEAAFATPNTASGIATGQFNFNFPSVVSTGSRCFTSNKGLRFISMPNLSTISDTMFYNCTFLQSVYIPSCTSISNWAFYNCTSLSFIDFSNCSYVGGSAFMDCRRMSFASFLKVETIETSAFYRCSSLTTVSFSNCSYIGTNAFYGCYNLLSFYLLGSSVPTLSSTNAFTLTPISTYTTSTGGVYGSIYVPSSLYTAYTTATNWITYASRFVSV